LQAFFQTSGKAAAILLVFVGSVALFAAGYFLRDINFNRENGSKAPIITPANPENGTDTLNRAHDMPVSGTTVNPATQQSGAGSTGEKIDQSTENTSSPISGSKSVDATGKIKAPTRDLSQKTSSAEHQTRNEKNGSVSALTSELKSGNGSPKNKTVINKSTSSKGEIMSNDPATSTGMLSYSQMMHEPATVPEPVSAHDVPMQEKKLDRSQAKAALPQNDQSNLKSPANIPVINKKSGSLNLPRFSITPVVSIQTTSNKVTADGSRWGNEMKNGIMKSEHLPNRIGGGILADMRISRNLTLQSGVILTQNDVHIDPKKVWAVKDIDGKVRYRFDCSAGTYYINPKQGSYLRPGDTATTRYSSNSLNYLNIPLSLKWHFGSSKFQFYAAAGAGLNLLTGQTLDAAIMHQYYYYGGRATNLKSSFFNGMIGAGLNYSFREKIGLSISPQYQFAITTMNENMPVKALPQTFSIQLGLQLKLK
jgi:hypothetical protein